MNINFGREDFYSLAVEDMDKQKSLYTEKQRVMVESLKTIDDFSEEDIVEKFENADATSKQKKEDLENRVRAALSIPEDQPVTKDVVIEYNRQKDEGLI